MSKLHPAMIKWQTEQTQLALDRYNENPNICQFCNAVIIPANKRGGIGEARKKKFCSHSCFASWNNKVRVRKTKPKAICLTCQKPCSHGKQRCFSCTVQQREYKVVELTKGALLAKRRNYTSARVYIGRLARKAYLDSRRPISCHICGYSRHINVCHIKAVAAFSKDTLISTINELDNLVALCPNHHWEYDNGILSLGAQPGVAPGSSGHEPDILLLEDRAFTIIQKL